MRSKKHKRKLNRKQRIATVEVWWQRNYELAGTFTLTNNSGTSNSDSHKAVSQ